MSNFSKILAYVFIISETALLKAWSITEYQILECLLQEFCQYRLLKPLDGEANFAEIEFIVDYNKTLAVFNNVSVSIYLFFVNYNLRYLQ